MPVNILLYSFLRGVVPQPSRHTIPFPLTFAYIVGLAAFFLDRLKIKSYYLEKPTWAVIRTADGMV